MIVEIAIYAFELIHSLEPDYFLHATSYFVFTDYLGKGAPDKKDMRLPEFRLIGRISGKWRVFGELLGIEDGVLSNISRQEYDIDEKFSRVFEQWKNNADLAYSPDYPCTWRGFRSLLEDAELSQVSNDYFAFLETL